MRVQKYLIKFTRLFILINIVFSSTFSMSGCMSGIKDDAKEMKAGFECGIGLDNFSKYKEGDIIVCYEIKSIKRSLVLS